MRDEQPSSAELHFRAVDRISRYLAARDHSEKELRQKLKRFYEKEVIEKAMAEARERGWLRPPEVLSELVAQQLDRRGKSAQQIDVYLQKKGLPRAPRQLERELEKAIRLLEQRFNSGAPADFNERMKAARWLKSRGFDHNTISAALKRRSYSPSE